MACWLLAFTPHAAPCEGGALADPRCCSMEVNYSPLDERKEGGDGALVQVHDSGDGGSTDSPMQIDHGPGEFSPSDPAPSK